MAIKSRILVMRHPETVANTQRFFSGRGEVTLSERGLVQREHGLDALVAFAPERIWCSPLSRCHDMASMAAERLGIECEVVDDLIELEFGVLEGSHFKGAFQGVGEGGTFPWPVDEHGVSHPAKGGESFEHAAERARRVLARLRGLDGKTALITHGGFSRVFLSTVYEIPYSKFWFVSLANVSSMYFTCDGTDFYLGGFNLSPEEVIERSTTPNIYDARSNIWGVLGREQK